MIIVAKHYGIKILDNFKFGIYYTGSDGGTTVVYFDEIRIGKTKDDNLVLCKNISTKKYN